MIALFEGVGPGGNLVRGVSWVATLAVLAVPPTRNEQPTDTAAQGGVDLSFRTDSVATAPGQTGVRSATGLPVPTQRRSSTGPVRRTPR
jgi:hypothetical protein